MPTSVILPPGGFSIAHWCLLVAALLPLACAYIAKAPGMKHRPGQRGFDNHEPRAWLAQQTGYQARANAAQANSFECLPFFIGALLVACNWAHRPRVSMAWPWPLLCCALPTSPSM